MALSKPKHLEPEYGAQFSDPSVARAYRFRPPYPDEVYTILERLLGDATRVVLELGCGLGEIARRLAAQMDRVDAVEPSHAMLERALATDPHVLHEPRLPAVRSPRRTREAPVVPPCRACNHDPSAVQPVR